jgi:hypothetical protein
VVVFPPCGVLNKDLFRFQSMVFSPFEKIRIHFVDSRGTPLSGEYTGQADSEGRYTSPFFRIGGDPGILQVRLDGPIHQPYGYFQMILPVPQTPHPKP